MIPCEQRSCMLHTSAGAAGEDPEAGMVLGLQEPSQRRDWVCLLLLLQAGIPWVGFDCIFRAQMLMIHADCPGSTDMASSEGLAAQCKRPGAWAA